MNKWKLAAVAVIALVAVVVVLQNTQPVETKLLLLTVTLPNAALLFGTLIIGFAVGVLTAGHIVSRAARSSNLQMKLVDHTTTRRIQWNE